jgi:alpha-L-fucosidase
MGMPRWWAERRYGLFLDASLASVPAWSPIGAPAERYQRHLGEQPIGGDEQPGPLVEVLAHHTDRWGHLDRYDDFAELLTYDLFDAEEWAALASRAGAGYTVLSAKHHDGWCWWDAPATTRTLVRQGPRRNVLAEYAAASERNELVLGAFYALDDWGDHDLVPSSDDLAVRLCDLVERFGVQILCGATDRHGIHPEPARLDDRAVERLAALDADLVIDDAIGDLCGIDDRRPSAPFAGRVVPTICGEPPTDIVGRPWQLCRPIGRSFGRNRTETREHQMTGADIVTLLTEVVAKGGNLLLGVGPAADGTISELHRTPLIEAGSWIREHQAVLRAARPWTTWGDDDARYWLSGDRLHAVDLTGDGTLSALTGSDRLVERIVQVTSDGHAATAERRHDEPQVGATVEVDFAQDSDGVRLLRQRRRPAVGGGTSGPVVYRIDLREAVPAVELFAPSPSPPVELAPIVEGALPGSIVQLGEGVYAGPATLPTGVTLRGLGPDRTTITTADGEVAIGRNARLEHLCVSSDRCELRPDAAASVRVIADGATLLGCRVAGVLHVDADDTTIRASRLCELRAGGVERLLVSRAQFDGDRRRTAISISGGSDHEIDSCEFSGHMRAIHIIESTGVAIAGNHIETRWWGIHLERTDRCHVHGNLMVSTMRAVDVDGGSSALIDGNAVFGGDSGCVVQSGATDCEVSGNHWERCRIGMLRWNTPPVRTHGNQAVDLYEPDGELVVGP